MGLDRAGHRREDPEWIAAAWADPLARVIRLGKPGVLLDPEASKQTLRREPVPPGTALEDVAFLGVEGDTPLFAMELGADDAGEARHLMLSLSQFDDDEGEVTAFAAGLMNWHATHGFCSVCGTASNRTSAGLTRTCPSCETIHYPRTDPVVQILVHDGERVLLGRSPQWPAIFFSVLAGFVEPGETPERAAIRETQEETGIVITEPDLHGMQPWPVPHQLLIAYTATCPDVSGAIASDDLEEVRLYTRDELRAAMDDRSVMVPPRRALAGAMLREWLGGAS